MHDAEKPARRLHIGGWEQRDGWEILDAVPRDGVHHLGDAADLSRFPDGTFAEVYASHVLQPGGRLSVSVPDLERLCHLYLTPGLSPDARLKIMWMIFGAHADSYDYHLVGFDEHYLGSVLQAAGFTGIQRVAGFNLFTDTSSMQVLGVPISLNMTATR